MPPDRPVSERIEALRTRIAELKSALPAHSVPPSMMIELEEMEEELEALLRSMGSEEGDGG